MLETTTMRRRFNLVTEGHTQPLEIRKVVLLHSVTHTELPTREYNLHSLYLENCGANIPIKKSKTISLDASPYC